MSDFLVFVFLIVLNTMSCPCPSSPLCWAVVIMELVVCSGGTMWAPPAGERSVLELLMEEALVVVSESALLGSSTFSLSVFSDSLFLELLIALSCSGPYPP